MRVTLQLNHKPSPLSMLDSLALHVSFTDSLKDRQTDKQTDREGVPYMPCLHRWGVCVIFKSVALASQLQQQQFGIRLSSSSSFQNWVGKEREESI